MQELNILVTICARGGSKGIPGKNLKILAGKPLLDYALKIAGKFAKKYSAFIQLSTDSDDILRVAKSLGYETSYKRPLFLATDKAGKIDAIRHAWKYAEDLNKKEFDIILDLDVTSPMRTINDLDAGLQELIKNSDAINLFSVNHAARNPYFNMVEKGENGFYKLVKNVGEIKSRQETPAVYDMNASFYFFRRVFMINDYKTSITDKSLIYVMPHICFDLDHPADLKIMELMITHNLLDFEL